jgi:hypothetical protein
MPLPQLEIHIIKVFSKIHPWHSVLNQHFEDYLFYMLEWGIHVDLTLDKSGVVHWILNIMPTTLHRVIPINGQVAFAPIFI